MSRTALLASLLVAAVGAVLLMLYKDRFEIEARGGAPVAVLMATRDIPAGTVLVQGMIGIRRLPQAYLEERHVRAGDAERLIGVTIGTEIKANETILWTDLATTNAEHRDLSQLVRSGMRAITIEPQSTPASVGLLRPGDRVDVLLTAASKDPSLGSSTMPLVQNVLVLAVGRDTGNSDEEARRAASNQQNRVTLSVSMAQAQLVALSADQGRLTLVLRNPDDITIQDTPPTHMSDLVRAGADDAEPHSPATDRHAN